MPGCRGDPAAPVARPHRLCGTAVPSREMGRLGHPPTQLDLSAEQRGGPVRECGRQRAEPDRRCPRVGRVRRDVPERQHVLGHLGVQLECGEGGLPGRVPRHVVRHHGSADPELTERAERARRYLERCRGDGDLLGGLVPGVLQRLDELTAGGGPVRVARDVRRDQLGDEERVDAHQAACAVPGVEVEGRRELVHDVLRVDQMGPGAAAVAGALVGLGPLEVEDQAVVQRRSESSSFAVATVSSTKRVRRAAE